LQALTRLEVYKFPLQAVSAEMFAMTSSTINCQMSHVLRATRTTNYTHSDKKPGSKDRSGPRRHAILRNHGLHQDTIPWTPKRAQARDRLLDRLRALPKDFFIPRDPAASGFMVCPAVMHSPLAMCLTESHGPAASFKPSVSGLRFRFGWATRGFVVKATNRRAPRSSLVHLLTYQQRLPTLTRRS